MSSRAMASAKNKRTSPFIMGNNTVGQGPQAPPQPINRTLSSRQRVAQLQSNQPRTMPPPEATRERKFIPPNPPQERTQVRRELSIPEAFAMINKKVSILEDVLEENGLEVDKFTTRGSNIDEKIALLKRELEDVIVQSIPDMNSIKMEIKSIKEEKDGEISLLNNALHELSEEFIEFRNRFEHEEISTRHIADDSGDNTLLTYQEDDGEKSLESSGEDASENIQMQINEHGDIETNDEKKDESRESEEVVEEVVEEVEEVISEN